jgi:3-methyladenine DNA glycosylase AlkD
MTRNSTLKANEWLLLIREAMSSNANFAKAIGMKKYMKELFSFYGIGSPQRRQLLKVLIVTHGKPDPKEVRKLAELLWAEEEREMQYAAMDLLGIIKKQLEPNDLQLIEKLITTKSWWDTVDLLASHLAGTWLLKFPENKLEILENWFASENMWLQRTVLIHQLLYKTNTNESILFDYINRLKDSKEFFIRKAIGWALRQHARTAPQSVRLFVETTSLSSLSVREATKHL